MRIFMSMWCHDSPQVLPIEMAPGVSDVRRGLRWPRLSPRATFLPCSCVQYRQNQLTAKHHNTSKHTICNIILLGQCPYFCRWMVKLLYAVRMWNCRCWNGQNGPMCMPLPRFLSALATLSWFVNVFNVYALFGHRLKHTEVG